jgi:ribosomal protein S18 acetylase RimI-like enzyme
MQDVDRLVDLMAEFYGESRYPLNRRRAAEAFATLLTDEQLGKVWLIQTQSKDVGYLVVTLGYSMEYGGRDAFVDDLFIRPAFRNQGLGTQALAEARAFWAAQEVRAVHLEVGRDNAAAQALYRRAGFEDTERQLLTLRLAEPTHADG